MFKRKVFFPVAVIIPIMGWYILFIFYPVIYALYTSFFLWIPENPAVSPFVGLKNYVELFTIDPRFKIALINTIVYVSLKTIIVVPVGLILALLLDKTPIGRRFYIFCIFLPALCSATAIGILFTYLYQPRFGFFNHMLTKISLPSQGFLSSSKQALYCVLATDIWQFLGFSTLIFYIGLINVPRTFTEAALIDGAGKFRIFWSVTVPLLGHTLLFISIYTMINAFQVFDFIFVMTSTGGGTGGSAGGPGYSSYILALLVYNEGMLRLRIGKATAVATILFIIVMVLTLLQFKVLKPKWEY